MEKILCPDCRTNYVSEEGKICKSCEMRRRWAEKKGEKYVKVVDVKKKGKKRFPDEVYQYVKEHASEDKTSTDLRTELVNIFGGNVFAASELSTYMSVAKLPFKRKIKKSKEKSIESKEKTVEIKEIPEKIPEDRFEPIEKEVTEILENKFKEMGCSLGYNLKIDNYIDAFKILRFLVNNYETIEKKRTDEWDIANAYQTDLIHEMENSISKPGDTYMQDKCHVLRSIRRDYEIDLECIRMMRPFLVSMNKDLTPVIDNLEKIKKKNEDFKYVPSVDNTLVDKYDWAEAVNPSSNLMQKNLLKTNSTRNMKKGLPVFVASCYISGAGYGTFKKWTKEVSYPTREEAENAIKIILDDIKKKNKNVLITDFNMYQKPA